MLLVIGLADAALAVSADGRNYVAAYNETPQTRPPGSRHRRLQPAGKGQDVILVTGTGWILIAALLVLALAGHPRRVPASARPALRWTLASFLLIETSAMLGLIAHQHDWAQIHRAIGAAELLLSLAALACLAAAVISRRRSRITASQAGGSPNT